MLPASQAALTPAIPLNSLSGASVFTSVPGLQDYQPDWRARSSRYQTYRHYYDGSVYNRYLALARVDPLINAKKLYEGTRLLFSPLERVVNVDVAKVPGGWAMNDQTVSQATRNRVAQLRKQIGAEQVYSQLVLYGAVAGECALLVSGDPVTPSVTALRPDDVVVGTLQGVSFGLVVKQTSDSHSRYEYAMLITPGEVRTYKDGQPYSYDGGPATRRNPFGVVTLFSTQYRLGEDGLGKPAFGGVLELLDRVNELASLTLDVVERNAEPILVGTGVTDIQRDPTHDTILTQNVDAKFYTIDPKLAIKDTLSFIQDVRGEYKNLLPQLTIDELRGAHDLAYDTVVTLLQELGDHILAVRSNLDPVIEQAERMLLGGTAAPADYALWRERRWLALTEMQQLEIDAQRLSIQAQQQAIAAGTATVQDSVQQRIQEK